MRLRDASHAPAGDGWIISRANQSFNPSNMSVLIVLLVASLSVALIFLGAFLWSVKNRQFDDDFSPPRRILFDDFPESNHLNQR